MHYWFNVNTISRLRSATVCCLAMTSRNKCTLFINLIILIAHDSKDLQNHCCSWQRLQTCQTLTTFEHGLSHVCASNVLQCGLALMAAASTTLSCMPHLTICNNLL